MPQIGINTKDANKAKTKCTKNGLYQCTPIVVPGFETYQWRHPSTFLFVNINLMGLQYQLTQSWHMLCSHTRPFTRSRSMVDIDGSKLVVLFVCCCPNTGYFDKHLRCCHAWDLFTYMVQHIVLCLAIQPRG